MSGVNWAICSCPSCDGTLLEPFYEVDNVPVNSVLLLPAEQEALAFPTGRISLCLCEACGFITNAAFDPRLIEYSARYESTQAYSATFSEFAKGLAASLIERHDLRGKDIIEIGCGQGEFLTLLCQLGGNRGVGFDPAYLQSRIANDSVNVEFVTDCYSEKYSHYNADFVCCKMTLEHIHDVGRFVRMVRNAFGDQLQTDVFFQVPNMLRVLQDLAFWDIYYEHCSYFSPGSLARLFRRCGFSVDRLSTEFDDQYLVIEAHPDSLHRDVVEEGDELEESLEALRNGVDDFVAKCADMRTDWQRRLSHYRSQGRKTAIWGGGSKAVSFLTTLGISDEIDCVVDINPLKRGTFLPRTGHEIVAPEDLRHFRPDVVVVMNPVYCAEIQVELEQMGISADMLSV